MKTLANKYGKPIDELDYLVLRYQAHAYLGSDKINYAIVTEDGYPICGTSGHPGDRVVLTTGEWRAV